MAYKRKSKKIKKEVDTAVAHVKSTFNNTIVTITTLDGDVLLSGSAGKLGYKGAKKGTPFAAAQVGELLGDKAKLIGMKEVDVVIKGVGSGRESAVRGFMSKGIMLSNVKDVTPVPHNGPRPPKPRRV